MHAAVRSAMVEHVPPPSGGPRDGPLQLQVSSLDYDAYVGTLGIGQRFTRGRELAAEPGRRCALSAADGAVRNAAACNELFGFHGLKRVKRRRVSEAGAGDIVVFSGIEDLSDLRHGLCPRDQPEGLPAANCRRTDDQR